MYFLIVESTLSWRVQAQSLFFITADDTPAPVTPVLFEAVRHSSTLQQVSSAVPAHCRLKPVSGSAQLSRYDAGGLSESQVACDNICGEETDVRELLGGGEPQLGLWIGVVCLNKTHRITVTVWLVQKLNKWLNADWSTHRKSRDVWVFLCRL